MKKDICMSYVPVDATYASKFQGQIENLKYHEKRSYLTLRHEKRNKQIPHAVVVLAHTPNATFKVGYLPANLSLWVSTFLDEKRIIRVSRERVFNIRNTPSNAKIDKYDGNYCYSFVQPGGPHSIKNMVHFQILYEVKNPTGASAQFYFNPNQTIISTDTPWDDSLPF